MTSEPFQIGTQDGVMLTATSYVPTLAVGITVVINSGVAVRRRFYDNFATYLCENGLNVITYDYRGIGDSLDEPLSECHAKMADWATKDFPAVVTAIAERYPNNAIKLVGHSFGGQILGVAPNHEKISAVLTVASQSGYWKLWPAMHRYALAVLWFALMPGLTALMSYFPAKRLKLGENLPAGVARQWAKWCRSPDYLRTEMRAAGNDYFDHYQGPIWSLSFDDDREAPRTAVDALHAMFTKAELTREHIAVSTTDHKKIGHFGFFKMSADNAIWRRTLTWLSAGEYNH